MEENSSTRSSFTQQAKELHEAYVEEIKRRKSTQKTDNSVEDALNDLNEAIDTHSHLTRM